MSQSERPVLEVEQVAKRFGRSLRTSLRYGLLDTMRDLVGQNPRAGTAADEFWAVAGASFSLRRGESLGLLGVNGAGKSTLLKMIAGLLKPDRGSIGVRGRIGALIELGAGMHPLLSGRENIRVNAAILGLTRRELAVRSDEIIAFADLGEFLDAPVQSYSSGMRLRLGFAVAAHTDPDLLLIDEVLAVGDAEFRSKCYERLAHLKEHCAIVLVSHVSSQLARLCSRGLVLHAGRVEADEPIAAAINRYQHRSIRKPEARRAGSGAVRLTTLSVQAGRGEVSFGEPLRLELTVESRLFESVVVDIAFRTADAQAVAECSNFIRKVPLPLRPGSQRIVAEIPSFTLNPGKYFLCVYITSPDMLRHHEWFDYCGEVTVTGLAGIASQQFIASWHLHNDL